MIEHGHSGFQHIVTTRIYMYRAYKPKATCEFNYFLQYESPRIGETKKSVTQLRTTAGCDTYSRKNGMRTIILPCVIHPVRPNNSSN
jgi:hypothetical protein